MTFEAKKDPESNPDMQRILKENQRLVNENRKLRSEIRQWQQCHESDLKTISKLQTQIDYLIGHH